MLVYQRVVNWDDEIPNMMGKIKAMFQTTNQISIEISGYPSSNKNSNPYHQFISVQWLLPSAYLT